MNARSRLPAPAPRGVTPDRVALASVAALALAVTPTLLATSQVVGRDLDGSAGATAFLVVTTTALSLLIDKGNPN